LQNLEFKKARGLNCDALNAEERERLLTCALGPGSGREVWDETAQKISQHLPSTRPSEVAAEVA